jgi:hypothetical protein
VNKSDYPNATDLRAFMETLEIDGSLEIPANFSYADAIEAAITAWETDSGWFPFKATTRTVTFDPPGYKPQNSGSQSGGSRILNLRLPLLSVSSLTIDGVSKVANQDFWLLKSPRREHSWVVRFGYPIFAMPNGISITGSFGYQATGVPVDVWEAILNRAVWGASDVLQLQLTGGVVKWDEGNAGEDYGISPLSAQIRMWRQKWSTVIAAYKPLVAWL